MGWILLIFPTGETEAPSEQTLCWRPCSKLVIQEPRFEPRWEVCVQKLTRLPFYQPHLSSQGLSRVLFRSNLILMDWDRTQACLVQGTLRPPVSTTASGLLWQDRKRFCGRREEGVAGGSRSRMGVGGHPAGPKRSP